MFLIKMLKKEIKNAKIKLFLFDQALRKHDLNKLIYIEFFFFFTYLLGTVLTNQQ